LEKFINKRSVLTQTEQIEKQVALKEEVNLAKEKFNVKKKITEQDDDHSVCNACWEDLGEEE